MWLLLGVALVVDVELAVRAAPVAPAQVGRGRKVLVERHRLVPLIVPRASATTRLLGPTVTAARQVAVVVVLLPGEPAGVRAAVAAGAVAGVPREVAVLPVATTASIGRPTAPALAARARPALQVAAAAFEAVVGRHVEALPYGPTTPAASRRVQVLLVVAAYARLAASLEVRTLLVAVLVVPTVAHPPVQPTLLRTTPTALPRPTMVRRLAAPSVPGGQTSPARLLRPRPVVGVRTTPMALANPSTRARAVGSVPLVRKLLALKRLIQAVRLGLVIEAVLAGQHATVAVVTAPNGLEVVTSGVTAPGLLASEKAILRGDTEPSPGFAIHCLVGIITGHPLLGGR